MRWVIPRLSTFLAKSQELLILFSIGWALLLASTGELMGFSGEVGAFLAGVSLASSAFRDLISSRLVSLRDFLLLFFFVNLGSNIDIAVIGDQLAPAIIFSLFVLVGNPIIVLIIMGTMGYRKRTSFLAGLTVAQISEFSLIFAGLGLAVGHITEQTVGLITLVGLITIGLSTYMILYSHQLYELLSPVLGIFQRKNPRQVGEDMPGKTDKYDIIIIGLGRFGSRLAEMIDSHPETNYLGIDFDPGLVKRWQENGKNIIYGDMEDPELFEQVDFSRASTVVSTVPDYSLSVHLMRSLNHIDYQGSVFLTAITEYHYQQLETCGADGVLMPHQMAAANFYNEYLKPGT